MADMTGIEALHNRIAKAELGPVAEETGRIEELADGLAHRNSFDLGQRARVDACGAGEARSDRSEAAGGAGLTPLRPSPAVDKLLAEQPFWKPFVDGIAFGGPEPLFTDYKGFQNATIEMVQSVVTGSAEPQAALTKAAAALEEYK